MAGKKKELNIGFDIVDAIRLRIRKEARDLDCLEVLRKRNPELAQFLEDLDNIITQVAYQGICQSMAEFRANSKRKHQKKLRLAKKH